MHGFNAICVAPNNVFFFGFVLMRSTADKLRTYVYNTATEWCNGVDHRRQMSSRNEINAGIRNFIFHFELNAALAATVHNIETEFNRI